MAAESLPGMDVREVDLHDRQGDGGDGVPEGVGVVGQSSGVDDDGLEPLTGGAVDEVDENPLVVRLAALDPDAPGRRVLPDGRSEERRVGKECRL